MATLPGKNPKRKQVIIAVVIIIAGIALTNIALFYASKVMQPPYGLHRSRVDFGVKWAFTGVPKEVNWRWDDIEIYLQQGNGSDGILASLAWFPASEMLTNASGGHARQFFIDQALQSVLIWCNVTDLKGNGRVDGGDYFTFTTGSSHPFSSETNCTLLIFNTLNGTIIRQDTFNG